MIMAHRKTSATTFKADPEHPVDALEAPRTASRRPASTFPITIAEWPWNGDDLVRVRIDRFNNSFTIDIRCWVREPDGVFKPRPNGLRLGIKHVTKLADTLAQARDRAELWSLAPAANSKRRRATER